MYNRQTNRTVVVPFHSKELKKGTEARIFKEAGTVPFCFLRRSVK
ncbi:MAG: type II toxin-antitoxin system HicA family toxin [Ruminococcus sp.]|nr:type II toxin-antitoxin system HicA family toxin [Ruminococcus sp.]